MTKKDGIQEIQEIMTYFLEKYQLLGSLRLYTPAPNHKQFRAQAYHRQPTYHEYRPRQPPRK